MESDANTCNSIQFAFAFAFVNHFNTKADPKWRFFWKLNKKKAENVIPSNMRNFESLCDSTGNDLLNTAYIIAEGIAMGLGLNRSYFRSQMNGASNLLAPTATDLNKYGAKGTIIAGYHYDLNLLTVHGKSRYDGLYIWLRDGRKVKVKIPDGYLVCQAAKQLEWVTGGYIFAGYHEVVVDDGTLKCMQKWKKLNRPLWRISMTMFSHFRSDVKLEIIRQFKTAELVQKYPPITTYDQVMQELEKIGLAANNS